MDAPWQEAPRRLPSAPIATVRTRFWRRAIRSRPFSSSTCPPPAPNATPPSSRSSCGASTGRRSPAEIRRRQSVPTAMAFTPSSRTLIRIPPSRPRTWRGRPARCHEGVRLSQEFGFEGRRATTYLASYHGLASKLGSQVLANCASCHGVHNILPSSDPHSTINKANLVNTCGQCHPGVTEKFVAAKVHVDAPLSADTGSMAVHWIRKFYLTLIAFVIGSMAVHNLVIWRRKAILRRKAEQRLVTRMSRNQRFQHMLLFASFIVLVLTGFALKFPDSWFAALLGMSERVRGITHRVVAVVLIGVGTYHLFYITFSRAGRRLIEDFLPIPKDATDVWRTLRYYLGLDCDKPDFARFNYAEKAEYWALVWGLFVMATTGIMLWAKVSFGNLLPRWWLDIATAIHFYEAVLATLAIVVWHFYQVFFDPDVYPMNWAWWDGKMPLEHYREEHALDAETLLEAARTRPAERTEEQAAPVPEPAKVDVEVLEADREPVDPRK